MKRFLSECRVVSIVPLTDLENPNPTGERVYQRKFKLAQSETADNNELVIGSYDEKSYLFIYKTNLGLFALTHDDFTFDFLNQERLDLFDAFNNITIPDTTDVVQIPLDDGSGV
jgi:hypothetical protein